MSEGNKKSGGNYRAQSALTIARNKRLKGERHAKRMLLQANKVHERELLSAMVVPRGAARAARREHLRAAYALRAA